MSSIDLFLSDSTKPLAKPRFVCYEEDWKLLQSVFPETGFTSYFPGFLINVLATHLREHGITSYFERSERPELANIPNFLSNIRFARDENNADDRRGTGPACSEVKKCEGEPASDAKSSRGKTEEGKGSVEGEESRLERSRTLARSCCRLCDASHACFYSDSVTCILRSDIIAGKFDKFISDIIKPS